MCEDLRGVVISHAGPRMTHEFFGERIQVEKEKTSPRPLRFTWRGEVHEVAAVLQERVDTGFGSLPSSSRKWYMRRHRRYYVVRDSAGATFEMYLDYAHRKKPTWWLVRTDQTDPPDPTNRSGDTDAVG